MKQKKKKTYKFKDGKKRKKIITNEKIKKSKKIKKSNNQNPLPEPSIDNKLNNIDVLEDDRKPLDKFKKTHESVNWGIGLEHEMHIFHKPNSGMKNANIIFDSQESSCFISGDNHPQGACKKMRNKPYFTPSKKILNMILRTDNEKMTEEELDLIEYLDWELSGRQLSGCENKIILPRTPVLMPEIVTGNFRNRSIDSVNEELAYLEKLYLDAQMKNPFTKEKVSKYGNLVTHLCGSHNDIKVPIRPTITEADYQFKEGDVNYKDYLGSYHITVTLPYRSNISKKNFVNMHRDMANQFQWIEPLLIAGFFSPDMDAVGSSNNPKVRGSFRVMSVGWGNFAGSDVRKFGTSGISRGANIKSYWRKKVKFNNKLDKHLNFCLRTAKPSYKRSTEVLNSDFRTFNFVDGKKITMKDCKRDYSDHDCPKLDGGLMEPPYGMEIRIFDHFPQEYLIQMLRIVTLIGGNSMRHPPTEYVYRDSRWINSLNSAMKKGWMGEVSNSYLNALRKNLGIPLNMPCIKIDNTSRRDSRLLIDVLRQVIHELFVLNKDNMINQLMNEYPNTEPNIPNINRMCYELECNSEWMGKLLGLVKNIKKEKNITSKKTKVTINVFEKYLFQDPNFNKSKWYNEVEELLYTLESSNKVKLYYDGYHISHFNILI